MIPGMQVGLFFLRAQTIRNLLAAATEVPENNTDRKSTRLNSSHGYISYAVFCLKKKITLEHPRRPKVNHSFMPSDFDHATLRRQVALQDDQSCGGLDLFRNRPHNFLSRRLLSHL